MRILITAALFLSCLLLPACADDTAPLSPLRAQLTPATMEFVHVCFAYAQAIRDHGVQGVKQFTTSDFVLRSPSESSHGDKAYKELSDCIDCFHGDPFTASVHPLTINKAQAVVLTRNTFQLQLGTARGSVISEWKQTWRKTAQGWKLVQMETDPGAMDNVQGLTFTTESLAKDKPVKAQAKQNVVK